MSAVPDRSEIGPYLGGHWATPRGPSANSVSPEHLRVRAMSPKAPRLRRRTARRSVPTSEVIGLHPGVRPLSQSHLSTSELGRFLRKRHVCGAGPLGDRSLPRMPSGDLGGFYNFGLPVKRLKPRQRWRRRHGEEEGYPRLRRGLASNHSTEGRCCSEGAASRQRSCFLVGL